MRGRSSGARLLSDLAEEVGLTDGLSVAMAPTKKRYLLHRRGDRPHRGPSGSASRPNGPGQSMSSVAFERVRALRLAT